MSHLPSIPHGHNLSPFFYNSLPGTKTQQVYIRVFNLLPGPADAHIEGTLSTVPFDVEQSKKPQYECLSYAWGDASDTTNILLDGNVLAVTRNLHTALHRFRLPDRVRTLWIDAICINQGDDQEKSDQVGLMQQIYEAATRVLVWLGEAYEGSDAAFALFKRLLTSLGPITLRKWRARRAHGPGYEPQPSERFAWEHDGNLLAGNEQYFHNPLYESLGNFEVFAQSLQDWLPEDAAPHESDVIGEDGEVTVPISHEVGTATLLLLARLFWTRIWVVQEIVVAEEALVCCGPDELDWWLLNLALGHLMSSSVRTVGNEAGLQRFTSICLTRHSILSGKSDSSSPSILAALSILQHYRCCGATDKRDKIYAILGVIKCLGLQLEVIPDYTIEPRQLYINFARMTLQTAGNLDLFAISHGRDKTLPSWVPDWSDDSYQPNLLFPLAPKTSTIQATHRPFTASGNSTIKTENLFQGDRLLLQGYQHDSLARVARPFRWLDGSKDVSEYHRALYNWMQAQKSEGGADATEPPQILLEFEREMLSVPFEFWKTMREWYALATEGSPDSYSFTGEPLETALIRTMEGDHLPNGIEEIAKHWRHLWKSLEVGIAAGERLMEGSTSPEDQEGLMTPALLPGTDKEWDAPLYGPGNRRCLARTKRGYLALVGQEAKEGDEVVLLRGGRTPYIVREEKEKEGWALICDAYVHGIMYGEAWDAGRCGEMVLV